MIALAIISLIVAIAALIIAIIAYSRAGGIPELRKQTESLRGKAADALNKVETALRAKEEKEAVKEKEAKEEKETEEKKEAGD
jgi:predicted Holliday junction resolvase-like endonuclease